MTERSLAKHPASRALSTTGLLLPCHEVRAAPLALPAHLEGPFCGPHLTAAPDHHHYFPTFHYDYHRHRLLSQLLTWNPQAAAIFAEGRPCMMLPSHAPVSRPRYWRKVGGPSATWQRSAGRAAGALLFHRAAGARRPRLLPRLRLSCARPANECTK